MIKNVLLEIGGVGLYGIIALSIFFLFFIGMLLWVMRLNKSYLVEAERMPLEFDLNRKNQENNHE